MQYKILKKLTVITLVFCVLLAGCKSQKDITEVGGEAVKDSEGEFVYVPDEFEKVEYAAMPDLNDVTMSLDKVNEAYRPHTEWRIYSIRATKSTITTPEGCTSWYVSPNGDDTNDGKTPETAIKTLGRVNAMEMKEGDVVYFECNGLWRGQISAKQGVTYTSYGEGAKPQFRSYAENVAGQGKWLPTDIKNVYVFYRTVSYDVGLIVFNEGESYGLKAFTYTGDDGKTYDGTTKKAFKSYKDLNRDLHFTHERGKVYLRSDKGNPSDRYSSIELCVKKNLVAIPAGTNNVTIDNLCFKYGGAHGVGAGGCDGLTVTNSEFYWIGGSAQNEIVRYGNGVEIYGPATNYRVENCYFHQIYDAAVTFQFGSTTSENVINMENINIKNNVIEYAYYSIEYFLGSCSNENSGIRNVNIEGNLCWYAGKGYKGYGYPKNEHAAHIKSWVSPNPFNKNFVIKNNLFLYSGDVLVETISTAGGDDPIYSNNIYIQGYKNSLGFTGNNDSNRLKFTAENIKNGLKDTTGKYIFIK